LKFAKPIGISSMSCTTQLRQTAVFFLIDKAIKLLILEEKSTALLAGPE
jgi:hypothetical protein